MASVSEGFSLVKRGWLWGGKNSPIWFSNDFLVFVFWKHMVALLLLNCFVLFVKGGRKTGRSLPGMGSYGFVLQNSVRRDTQLVLHFPHLSQKPNISFFMYIMYSLACSLGQFHIVFSKSLRNLNFSGMVNLG